MSADKSAREDDPSLKGQKQKAEDAPIADKSAVASVKGLCSRTYANYNPLKQIKSFVTGSRNRTSSGSLSEPKDAPHPAAPVASTSSGLPKQGAESKSEVKDKKSVPTASTSRGASGPAVVIGQQCTRRMSDNSKKPDGTAQISHNQTNHDNNNADSTTTTSSTTTNTAKTYAIVNRNPSDKDSEKAVKQTCNDRNDKLGPGLSSDPKPALKRSSIGGISSKVKKQVTIEEKPTVLMVQNEEGLSGSKKESEAVKENGKEPLGIVAEGSSTVAVDKNLNLHPDSSASGTMGNAQADSTTKADGTDAALKAQETATPSQEQSTVSQEVAEPRTITKSDSVDVEKVEQKDKKEDETKSEGTEKDDEKGKKKKVPTAILR